MKLSIIPILYWFIAFTYAAESSYSLNSQQEVELFTKVVSDISANPSDYVNFIQTGDAPLPLDLLGNLAQISTYTDDSYTTMLQNSEVESNLMEFVTALPWYNERLAGDGVPSLTTPSSDSSETNSSKKNSGYKIYGSSFGLLVGLILAL